MMETSLIKEDLNKTPEKSAQDYDNSTPVENRVQGKLSVYDEIKR